MTKHIVNSSSLYDYYFNRDVEPAVLVIRDMDIPGTDETLRADGPFRSVTNNLDQVVSDIEAIEGKSLAGTPIIYRDSLLHYDGLACGDTVRAYSLGNSLFYDAALTLRAIRVCWHLLRKGATI